MAEQYKTIEEISGDEAMAFIYNWLEYSNLNSNVQTGFKRSFVVSFEDLEKIYEVGDGFRVYLGKNNIDSLSEMRLILVPVDENQQDMIEESIYDFSTPCPHTCQDTKSKYYSPASPAK